MAARTDTGLKRAHNEDSVGNRIDSGVVVLADGMGGSKAGEVASAIAVNTLLDSLSSISDEASDHNPVDNEPASIIAASCAAAAMECNRVIYQTAERQPQYKGMGTTIVASVFFDNRMIHLHVGDSRIYRFRDNTLQQLTIDHTLVQELIETGAVSVEEARHRQTKISLLVRSVPKNDWCRMLA